MKIYVKDESKLPAKPSYQIDDMTNLIGVAARGKYGRGEGSKAVFINSKTQQKVGEVSNWHRSAYYRIQSGLSTLGVRQNRYSGNFKSRSIFDASGSKRENRL